LERAKLLLETTYLRVQEIEVIVGYKDSKRFAHDFKAVYDFTPSQHRRRHRMERPPIRIPVESAALKFRCRLAKSAFKQRSQPSNSQNRPLIPVAFAGSRQDNRFIVNRDRAYDSLEHIKISVGVRSEPRDIFETTRRSG